MEKHLLVLCGSLKPPRNIGGKSATREILKFLLKGMDDSGFSDYEFLDIRELDLPFYDGRKAEEYNHDGLNRLYKSMLRADVIVVSAPAYWRLVAGGLINAINLVGGPLYDYPERSVLFQGKEVYLIVVGAEYADAVHGAAQLRLSFSSMGAMVNPKEILIGNLRHSNLEERKLLAAQLYQLGVELAKKFRGENEKGDNPL